MNTLILFFIRDSDRRVSFLYSFVSSTLYQLECSSWLVTYVLLIKRDGLIRLRLTISVTKFSLDTLWSHWIIRFRQECRNRQSACPAHFLCGVVIAFIMPSLVRNRKKQYALLYLKTHPFCIAQTHGFFTWILHPDNIIVKRSTSGRTARATYLSWHQLCRL